MSSILLHWTGGDTGNSTQYLELSGFLTIVLPPLLTLAGLALLAWWHSRCHIDRCLRHGKHPFHHYRLCAKHHPETPQGGVSHWHIIKLHKEGHKNGDKR